MPITVSAQSGGFAIQGDCLISKRLIDHLDDFSSALKAAKLPKSAKWFDELKTCTSDFNATGYSSEYNVYPVSEAEKNPIEVWNEKTKMGNMGCSDPLVGYSNVIASIVRSRGTGSETLLNYSEAALKTEIEKLAHLHKLTQKCGQILNDKSTLLSAAVPQAYLWSLNPQYKDNSNWYNQKPISVHWSPTFPVRSPFSTAHSLHVKGYSCELVTDTAENFAISKSFAIFDPSVGLFMGKHGYSCAAISGAQLFEDLVSAKRSQVANRLQNRTFIAELEVRALRIAHNPSQLSEGPFSAATIIAEKTALDDLMKQMSAEQLQNENTRLKEQLGASTAASEPAPLKRRAAL